MARKYTIERMRRAFKLYCYYESMQSSVILNRGTKACILIDNDKFAKEYRALGWRKHKLSAYLEDKKLNYVHASWLSVHGVDIANKKGKL